MMKNSSLLKWTNNKLHNNKNNKNANKSWIHPPEALQSGHIAYLVKFLGSTEVSQSKGIEVVKEAIKKLKFNQQIKKSEGSKIPKVDLTISVDGVAIQQPKSKKISSQYPLHRISYCADDKAEKRFFSFIAKEADKDVHTCFVFVSDKLAEEITLTIGQAFDLAYRRFVETSSREIELRRQISSLQHQLQSAEVQNSSLKSRLKQISTLKNRPDLEQYMKDNNISDISTIVSEGEDERNINSNVITLLSEVDVLTHPDLPPVPPRNFEKHSISLIDDLLSSPGQEDSDDDFDPRAGEHRHHQSPSPPAFGSVNGRDSSGGGSQDDASDEFDPRAEESRSPTQLELSGLTPIPSLLPPPPPPRNHTSPFQPIQTDDPFFSPNPTEDVLAHFNEMKVGFSQGLTFGSTEADFTLESLDPLKN